MLKGRLFAARRAIVDWRLGKNHTMPLDIIIFIERISSFIAMYHIEISFTKTSNNSHSRAESALAPKLAKVILLAKLIGHCNLAAVFRHLATWSKRLAKFRRTARLPIQ